MDQSKNKKSIIFIIIGIVVLIMVIVGFVIALKNHKSKTTDNSNTSSNNETASDISKDYDDVNYGDSTNLSTTSITKGGSYDLTGDYSCITINTNDSVQLNLNNVTISCTSGPAINIEEAKTVNIVLSGENTITSTTTTDLDGAIYSKADLVFSGTGSLKIKSNLDGIVSKDTLVIKGGTYEIEATDDGIRGKDNVAIVDGTFTINAGGDGIKSTNEEDSTKGYVAIDSGTFTINSVTDAIQATTSLTISGGTFNIKTTGNTSTLSAKGLKATTSINISGGTFEIDTTDDSIHSNGNITITKGIFKISSKDDGIHADGLLQIDGGEYDITAPEGMEATYVKINGGTINISATDDAINAGNKSSDYSVTIEINGGKITIKMGQGDTDAIDSNGNLYINGGTIDITCNSPFDYDGEAKYTGGTLIVNGEETTEITNQMMGGGPGGMQGRGMR